MSGKFCPHCGAILKRAAPFCGACGRQLKQQPVVDNNATVIDINLPQLTIVRPGKPPQTFPITKPIITIGRSPQNDLIIDSPVVSRQHAELKQQGSEYYLHDLGSTNGSVVNGKMVQRGQSPPLHDGTIIRIGDAQGNSVGITFQKTAVGKSHLGTIKLGQLNIDPMTTYTIGRDPANQVHLDHPSVSRRHAEVRQTAAGAVLRDLGSANGTYINGQSLRGKRQLNNGDVIQIGPFKLVHDQAGLTQYTPDGNYQLDAGNLMRTVNIGGAVAKLTGDKSKQKVILNDISLSVHPKEFIALVGGSGAGKSTLMKAMSGFSPADQGTILINGDDLYKNFAAYRSILGYVPQDDIIHGQLTVMGALTYAAELRMPDATASEIKGRIQKALKEVDMVDHVDKQVNKLSGGQRKRVSIASELLADPGLFFLDEPTSGLDPGLEKKMMYTLRQLADQGRTIVLVTHATANIDQCTHVAFLAEGRLAYYGPPQEAKQFFDNAPDFSDIYTNLSQPINPTALPSQYQPYYQELMAKNMLPSHVTAAMWERRYRDSSQYQQYVTGRLQKGGASSSSTATGPQANQQISMFKQFGVLSRRYFNLIRRDTMSLVVLLAVMPVIALLLLVMADKYDLVGRNTREIRDAIAEDIEEARNNENRRDDEEQFQGIYQVVGSTQRVLFMVALAGTLLGLFAASYEIVKEDPIYQRERMVNLKIPPYLLSKLAVMAGFALLQSALLLIVLSFKLDFPAKGVFLPSGIEMYITIFLATLASISMGLLISAVVKSDGMVIYVILLVLFVQILFAGAIFEIPAAAKPVSYMTTTRWAMEALGDTVDMEKLKELGGGCLESEAGLPPGVPEPEGRGYCEDGQTMIPAAYEFNVNYDASFWHLLSRWLVLVLFTAVFIGTAAWVQKRKDVI